MAITRSQPIIKLGKNEFNDLDDHWRCHMPGAHLAVEIIIHNMLFQLYFSDDGQVGRAILGSGHSFVRYTKFWYVNGWT